MSSLLATTNKIFAGGSDDTIEISWGYLEEEHVKVYVDGVEVSFTFQSAGVLKLDSIPAASAWGKARRETPIVDPIVDHTDGATLNEFELDRVETAMRYIAQEAHDRLIEAPTEDFFGDLDAGGRRIINVGDPQDAGDAVNLGYIENIVAGPVKIRETATDIENTIFENAPWLTPAIVTLGRYAVGDAGKPLVWVRQEALPTSGTYVQSGDGDYWRLIDDATFYGETGLVVPDNNAVAADFTNPMGSSMKFAGRLTTGLPEANGGAPSAPTAADANNALLFRFPTAAKLANSALIRARLSLHVPAPSGAGGATVDVKFVIKNKVAGVSEHVFVEQVELDNDPLGLITGLWLLASYTEDEPYGIAITLNGHGAVQVGEISYVLDLDIQADAPLASEEFTRLAYIGCSQVTANDAAEAVNLLLEGSVAHISATAVITDETPTGGFKRVWRFQDAAELALDDQMTYNRVAVGDEVYAAGVRYVIADVSEGSPDVVTAANVKLLQSDPVFDNVQLIGKRVITGATTLTLADARKLIVCDFASDATVTLPQNVPDLTPFHFLWEGTGKPFIVAGGAEVLNTAETGYLEKQYSVATALVTDTGVWTLFGKLEAAP